MNSPPRIPTLTPLRIPQGAPPSAAAARLSPVTVSKATKTLSNLELLFRIAITFLLLGALVLVWWTYTQRLLPFQKQARTLSTDVMKLSNRVEELQRKWSRSDIDKIRADYAEAHQKLFADEAALRSWLDHLEELAVPLNLDVKVDIGKPVPNTNAVEKIAVIPTSVFLDIRPVGAGSETPYQRLLHFCQQLGAEGKRADLAELDASGGTESIGRALFIFNLWAGESAAQ
jgi:hypothetical protein